MPMFLTSPLSPMMVMAGAVRADAKFLTWLFINFDLSFVIYLSF